MLRTGCVYVDNSGLRVCVMSRLTANDGQTPARELILGRKFEYWSKILAPPDKLVGAWYREELNWQEFASVYRAYLSRPAVEQELRFWAHRALDEDVSLLCVEPSSEHCHRRILATQANELVPELEILLD